MQNSASSASSSERRLMLSCTSACSGLRQLQVALPLLRCVACAASSSVASSDSAAGSVAVSPSKNVGSGGRSSGEQMHVRRKRERRRVMPEGDFCTCAGVQPPADRDRRRPCAGACAAPPTAPPPSHPPPSPRGRPPRRRRLADRRRARGTRARRPSPCAPSAAATTAASCPARAARHDGRSATSAARSGHGRGDGARAHAGGRGRDPRSAAPAPPDPQPP